jgi:ubiquinone/menaquinone biosynthesis C-methylase UbiE
MKRAMSFVWSRAAWDTLFARAYNRTASKLIAGPYASLTDTLRTDFGMALDALPRGSVVLDAGCGPGHVTVRLARDAPQATVVGLDFSATMLGLGAATLAASKTGNWRLIQADSHHLPFGEGRFDLVLSTGALKNWADPVACLNEMYRVAKPNAIVVLAEVNRDATREDKDSWKRHLERALPRRPMGRRVRTWFFENIVLRTSFGPGDVEAMARKTSFRDIHLAAVRGYPFFFALMKKTGR